MQNSEAYDQNQQKSTQWSTIQQTTIMTTIPAVPKPGEGEPIVFFDVTLGGEFTGGCACSLLESAGYKSHGGSIC